MSDSDEGAKSPETLSSSCNDDVNDTLICLSFNQDGGCFSVGTATGFRICNVSPYEETFRRTFAPKPPPLLDPSHPEEPEAAMESTTTSAAHNMTRGGGIGCIEMLYRCNLLALVGGGVSPQYPPNKVIIWDDHKGRPIGELSFRQKVLAVRLRRDRVCVALRDRVFVYNFKNLDLLDTIVTGGEKNGLGLLCISTDAGGVGGGGAGTEDDSGMVLACPSVTRGQVRVELYGRRKTVLIDAHDSALAALALTVDGSLIATASERGTLIRLFDTGRKSANSSGGYFGGESSSKSTAPPPGTPLREFRRGVEQARIGSLAFSLDKSWLSCASDRGTVHVFQIHDKIDGEANGSKANGRKGSVKKSAKSSAKAFAKSLIPSVITKSTKKMFLEGQHSYVQVRGIPHPRLCAFVPDRPHTLAIVGLDDHGNGCLLLVQFGPEDESEDHGRQGLTNGGSGMSPTKGEARRIAYHRFFKKDSIINGSPPQKAGYSSGGTNQDNNMEGHESQLVIGEKSLGKTNLGLSEDLLTDGVGQITFDDNDPDGFVSVDEKNKKKNVEHITTPPDTPPIYNADSDQKEGEEEKKDNMVEREELETSAELKTDSPTEDEQSENLISDA